MTVSIFTIERRKNFPAAFSKFFEDLQSSVTNIKRIKSINEK